MRDEYEKLKLENQYLNRELEIERNLSDGRAGKNSELLGIIEELKNSPTEHVHNARNAGRKQKATPEQEDKICSLRQQGLSLGGIAKIMTDETNSKWNKMTILNVIKRKNINNLKQEM